MHAKLIDDCTYEQRPVREILAELLLDCGPIADRLGCATELASAEALAADTGDARQLTYAARNGLTELPGWLGDEFTTANSAMVLA
jgi:gamma-glutamyl:cysteine ligase YbdK (ATP-grasp superfamily)